MSAKRKAPQTWTQKRLEERFWWWRKGGDAFSTAFPDAEPGAREELFRRTLNTCAFNYELMARDGIRKDTPPRYEFGLPFNCLSPELMNMLRRRWPGERTARPFEVLGYDAQPEVLAALARLEEDIVDDGAEQDLAEHLRRMEQQSSIEANATKTGWTVPRYFRFNLGAYSSASIAKALERWLDAERSLRGIRKPKPNKNRKNRSKGGKAFTMIEALDVWTYLSREAADVTGIKEALKRRGADMARRLKVNASPEGKTET